MASYQCKENGTKRGGLYEEYIWMVLGGINDGSNRRVYVFVRHLSYHSRRNRKSGKRGICIWNDRNFLWDFFVDAAESKTKCLVFFNKWKRLFG